MWLFSDETRETLDEITSERKALFSERKKLIEEIHQMIKSKIEIKERELQDFQNKRQNYLYQTIEKITPKSLTIYEIKEYHRYFQVTLYSENCYVMINVIEHQKMKNHSLFHLKATIIYFDENVKLIQRKKEVEQMLNFFKKEIASKKEHRIKSVVNEQYIQIDPVQCKYKHLDKLEQIVLMMYLKKQPVHEISEAVSKQEKMIHHLIASIKERLYE